MYLHILSSINPLLQSLIDLDSIKGLISAFLSHSLSHKKHTLTYTHTHTHGLLPKCQWMTADNENGKG